MARALMLQGTGSDVGKTVLVAGLCRAALRRGLKVLPFKPQNMSNNAAVADDGGEIGRGQWLQAIAGGVSASVHMNPVLLKPQSETGAQIIVQGKMWGTAKGREYQALKQELFGYVMQSYGVLKNQADLILVEGAGSAAEINLRCNDIANMGFATAADIPVVLVGDIDRGGVIASLVGTHAILPEEDKNQVEGYIINKFRGDPTLFNDGLAAIDQYTGWHSYGVVPWIEAASRLPAEDSVILDRRIASKGHGIRIVIPISRHIANFDDIDPLRAEQGVDLIMVRHGEDIPDDADVILLLGSKSTIATMREFDKAGWVEPIRTHARRGGVVIGICGGLQMLGRFIHDPEGIEGNIDEIAGIGLLDIETTMEKQKTVRNVSASISDFDEMVEGYEIHLGSTTGADCAYHMVSIDNRPDGAASKDKRIWGTYLHGIFHAGGFRKKYLESLGTFSQGDAHSSVIETALDDIAIVLEKYIDLDVFFKLAR